MAQNPGTVVWTVVIIKMLFDGIKKIFFVYFICVRILSCAITYQFMIVQQAFKIQELDLIKDEFNRFERDASRIAYRILLVYSIAIFVLKIL